MLRRSWPTISGWVLMASASALCAAEPAPNAEELEFFEKRVRPLLVEKCLSCHGEKKQEGNLRLDSHAALLKGNESGPALVVGKPEASRLIKVLAYSNDDIQMPPAGKLKAEEIATLTEWVQRGGVFPASDKSSTTPTVDVAKHWAFQPISRPVVPTVKDAPQARTEIDSFILAALEAKGLKLAPPADRPTLLRRLSFDLHGLPPTYADAQAFAANDRPDAVERMVDQLLASPRMGERWSRYWLDIARYADTKGYVFTEEPRYPYAYTYRDYVIAAFNEDKPYDQFIKEQLAADQLNLGDDQTDLAAMGFLTLGRRFLNNINDITDDRIDVVTRGLMGLTVSCARCHDHKFDPIPTADYYSLYGVFQSSHEPPNLPTIGPSQQRAEYEKFAAELAVREKALADYEQQAAERISAECRTKVTSYLELIARPTAESPAAAARTFVNGDPRPGVIKRWQDYLKERAKQPDAVFGPWHHAAKAADGDVAATIIEWVHQAQQPGKFEDGADRVNRRVRQTLLEEMPTTLVEIARTYGGLLSEVNREWLAYKAANPAATALPDAADEELRQVLYAEGTPTVLKVEDAKKIFNRDDRNKQRDLAKKIETLKATSPGAPPRAMVMNDNAQPAQPHIFIRGNQGRPGPAVPRQFLAVAAGSERKPFQRGSGRLELAEAIVSPTNPLTARVIVNRVWQHHFGKGLVRSHGDFGIRGEAPTHPELLDYLAQRFIASGWSLKWLHRQILLSAVYQQSSRDYAAARAIDPENRLLWKMPRERLELEAMRDAWLAVSGRLDEALYGRPYDSIVDANSRRRTVYGLVNRNDLPNMFRAFD
ncbi:MAG TPA: PSD1 and planctomycete cytochrome C domain-containing protein, partial [Planctomycetaceae bacterium]|nr:PSD1 and planctomycete cytochrome C domain-containing protein [Planctomycetaceae bacterium]